MEYTDSAADSPTRYACVYWSSATTSAPLPLVVWFHGAQGSADDLYSSTGLRTKAISFALSQAAGRTGFVVAAVQGRNLQWPSLNPPGTHHDIYYRDLASPSANPDVRSADHLIDTLVASGKVDPKQIYVMGWSNGAFFAQLYSIARATTATPGGNTVAAAAVYAGADPFANTTPTQSPSCALSPYPQSKVPIRIVHRDCDAAVACDAQQQSSFGLAPGFDVTDWLTTAAASSGVGDPNVSQSLIDGEARAVTACATVCTKAVGALNHTHWPDGSGADKVDWEPSMLQFLQGG
jgi:poly(3-hydroxybutyrate) depolymerase